MISGDTIRAMAARNSIHPGVIEKDYVLSKALTAIAQSDLAKAALVFKGGTALKKCYYPTWRYSEDLDFTASRMLSPAQIHRLFQEVASSVGTTFGLPLRVSEYSQYPKDTDRIASAQLKLSYDGPLRQSSGQKNNIRIDVALDETVVLEPVPRSVFQEYADDIEVAVAVYPLEEIVAEKLRSIIQRGKSRDYYDVWVLLKKHATDYDRQRTKATFLEKCRAKAIPEPTMARFFDDERLQEAETYWERGLRHQVADLVVFQTMIAELRSRISDLIDGGK